MKIEEIYSIYVQTYNHNKKFHPLTISMGSNMIFFIDMETMYKEIESIGIEKFNDFYNKNKELKPNKNISILTIDRDKDYSAVIDKCLFHVLESEKGNCIIDTHHKVRKVYGEKNLIQIVDTLLAYIVYRIGNKETKIYSKPVEMKTRSGQKIIKPVTFLSTNKNINIYEREIGHPVKWTHCWEVMGHWRLTKSIGKDRDGKYNEIGRTWVNPSIKGDGELIKKIRFIR